MLTDRDRKFLRWCHVGAEIFSTCSRRQFLAIIVSVDGRVVGTGYNGAPSGMAHCTDGACPHARDALGLSSADSATCIAIHAEANAIMHSDRAARAGATLYVNGLPCAQCALLIVGSGIKRVVCTADGVGTGVDTLTSAWIAVDVLDMLPPNG